MNAGIEHSVARDLSASSEARQLMADWLRTTKTSQAPAPDSRQLLQARYPVGLFSDAELDVLIRTLYR